MRDAGVSVRLKAVQVIKYLPMEAASPFGVVADGFEMDSANPFETLTANVASAQVNSDQEPAVVSDDLFGDDMAEEVAAVEQPKKAAKKKSVAPKEEDKNLASIVDDWDG